MTAQPRYRTTKRQIGISTALAWLIIFMITAGGVAGVPEAVSLAGIAVPSMVMLIAALLGIHRFTGSMDFKASQEREAEEQAAISPDVGQAEPGNAP